MGQRFSGKTEDASSPILEAAFFSKGTKLEGRVIASFDTENGKCYNLELDKPIAVDGSKVSPKQKGKVEGNYWSVGAMAGFEMAMRACGLQELLPGDRIILTCTGTTPTAHKNPRLDFSLDVDRD